MPYGSRCCVKCSPGPSGWGHAAVRGGVARVGGVVRGGLLLVGTPGYEPWHLAAHLVDEAAWSGTPELTPTLVRHDARPSDPAHLAVGLGRIEAARRGETLLVVSPEGPGDPLLERVHDARRAGATVLSLGSGNRELASLAHESLPVPPGTDLDLDTVQHLVSAAAGENVLPATRGAAGSATDCPA